MISRLVCRFFCHFIEKGSKSHNILFARSGAIKLSVDLQLFCSMNRVRLYYLESLFLLMTLQSPFLFLRSKGKLSEENIMKSKYERFNTKYIFYEQLIAKSSIIGIHLNRTVLTYNLKIRSALLHCRERKFKK